MKEIRASELNVGDVVYNCISVTNGWTHIGSYYRKEVVKRITPKRTKIVTDFGEYKAYYRFYEYSEEMEETNRKTIARKEIYHSAYTLDRLIKRDEKYKTLYGENLLKVSKMLAESIKILKGDECE